MNTHPTIRWTEAGEDRVAHWRSESGVPPPERVVVVDDRMPADEAYGLACQGTSLLWRGDFQNARQLLVALGNRVDRKPRKAREAAAMLPPVESFHRHRLARAQRARTLGRLLVALDADYGCPLRRAPDMREACAEAWGPGGEPCVVSLRELQGIIGAHEWRTRGIAIPTIDGRIHPHYGVFAPIRREYVDLVAQAPLPAAWPPQELVAFDIGTGTGVLAAVLARRGIGRVVATDNDARALACARENIARLALDAQVEVVEADLFPPGRAMLVACNPPWVPARPSSPIERGIFDEGGGMLRAFLAALPDHLEPQGEGWLVLSDLAELLGLRTREDLLAQFEAAGLRVIDRIDVRPRHPRAADESDALHAARAAEVTSLWRLGAR